MKKFFILIFLASINLICLAQTIQQRIQTDVVVIKDGKYTATKYVLLKLGAEPELTTKQVKVYAEAPATGIISRDYFVFLFQTTAEKKISEEIGEYKSTRENLTELVGNPDIEINIYMAKTGIQIEVKKDGTVDRSTKKWEEEKILNDIVVVKDGKFTITKFVLIKFPANSSKQLKAYAEAPADGVISRDKFVSVAEAIIDVMIEKQIDDPDLAVQENLNELIGKPDIEVNVYMAKTGLQIEVKQDGTPERITKKWEDLE